MAPLAVNFKRELTRPTMTLFWSEFQHLRPDDFRDAVTEVIRTHKFFPTIAEMRDALGMGQADALVEAASTFDALLGDGPRYDPRTGDYWTLEDVTTRFGPRALAAFLVAGGTRAFRDRTTRNVEFLRRDFLRGWTDYRERQEPPHFPRPVPVPSLPEATVRGLHPASEALRRILPPADRGDAWEPTPKEEE